MSISLINTTLYPQPEGAEFARTRLLLLLPYFTNPLFTPLIPLLDRSFLERSLLAHPFLDHPPFGLQSSDAHWRFDPQLSALCGGL